MELKSKDIEKKLSRKDFFKEIEKANSGEYETEWTDTGRIGIQKRKSMMKTGSKSRAQGGQFELRVRKDLEAKGWIVDKWSNNLDLDLGKVVPAKRRFNPFSKVMTIGTGFPDFVAFQRMEDGRYTVIGVEVKMNGMLSKIEKEKCLWYLENRTFSEIWIARKVKEKNRVRVEYLDIKEILKHVR